MLKTEIANDNHARSDFTSNPSATTENQASSNETKPLILIVDDNAENLQYLGNLLSDNDYEPAVTINGNQALDFLELERPELILLDVMMPGMDGFEVCKRIKSNPEIQKIPIMFLTANTDSADLVKGFELGALDYLTKPFNPSELLIRVKTHIELHQTRRALEKSNKTLKEREDKINQLNKILSSKFEEKAVKLEHAREEILQQEYKSEMADVATGTLHNVKNLLNGVKTSSVLIMEDILRSESTSALKKANQLLRENIDSLEDFISNDPKGRILMDYYLNIEEVLDREVEVIESELLRISDKVISIESNIGTQQVYGKTLEENEVLDLHKIIEDALIMLEKLIISHEISIEKDFADIPLLHLQKQKFLHVLINLIRNAKDAMLETAEQGRKLTFKTELKNDRVDLIVSDNGCGIKAEDLPEIFSHGFTTKKDGHGYGLHSSYNYINEMNGKIIVESEGLGKGARFVISLPLNS